MTGVRVRSRDVTWQEVDGDVVVLDLTRATYLRIGGAGTVLWPLIADGADEEDLASTLVHTFAITEEQARADVDEFLRSLIDQDLVVRSGPPAADLL